MGINKRDRGITLIALVVTIIVLLILAGVSISMLTGQNGILRRAAEAKEKTEESEKKEKTDLATVEGLIDEYGKTSKGWTYLYDANGMPEKVTNGQGTILTIGDYINYNPADYDGYDETKNGFYNSPAGTIQENTTYTETKGSTTWQCAEASTYQKLLDNNQVVKGNGSSPQTYKVSDANGRRWRVLGADETTGELLIISDDVLKENNATKKMTFKGITGYLYGVDELNKVCNIYGKGSGATGARSLTFDDVNKAIGKEREENTGKWTYTWTEDSLVQKKPSYDGGTNFTYYPHVKDGTNIGVFNYYNVVAKKWETRIKDLTNFTGKEDITTINPDYVGFDISNNPDYVNNRATKGYKLLFKDNITEEDKYWVGTSYCSASSYSSYWGMYCMCADGCIYGDGTYYSFGYVNEPSYGIRPVVTLKSDIQLQSTSESGVYNIKN